MLGAASPTGRCAGARLASSPGHLNAAGAGLSVPVREAAEAAKARPDGSSPGHEMPARVRLDRTATDASLTMVLLRQASPTDCRLTTARATTESSEETTAFSLRVTPRLSPRPSSSGQDACVCCDAVQVYLSTKEVALVSATVVPVTSTAPAPVVQGVAATIWRADTGLETGGRVRTVRTPAARYPSAEWRTPPAANRSLREDEG